MVEQLAKRQGRAHGEALDGDQDAAANLQVLV
jgi:hypothetical protein